MPIKQTKTDAVIGRLREAILRGEIAPGEWLRQEEIATRFELSPTPVREAFRRLESDGLIDRIPHQGVRVPAYTLDIAREYYDLRALLEPYAVRLAIARMSEEDVEGLRRLVAESRRHLARHELGKLTDVNWQFHERLVSACGSRLVQDVLTRVRRSFQLDTLLIMSDRAVPSVHEHEAILEAVSRRHAREAARLVKRNIENARAAMLVRLPSLATSARSAARRTGRHKR